MLASAAVPLRVPRAAVWVLAAANGVDWLLSLSPNGPRFLLALALCWTALGPLLASHERAASN